MFIVLLILGLCMKLLAFDLCQANRNSGISCIICVAQFLFSEKLLYLIYSFGGYWNLFVATDCCHFNKTVERLSILVLLYTVPVIPPLDLHYKQ